MLFLFNHIAYLPFLIALVPIFLARTWHARKAAILFGSASVGFAFYFVSSNTGPLDTPDGLRQVWIPVIGGLGVAFVSVTVTFRLDRKQIT